MLSVTYLGCGKFLLAFLSSSEARIAVLVLGGISRRSEACSPIPKRKSTENVDRPTCLVKSFRNWGTLQYLTSKSRGSGKLPILMIKKSPAKNRGRLDQALAVMTLKPNSNVASALRTTFRHGVKVLNF